LHKKIEMCNVKSDFWLDFVRVCGAVLTRSAKALRARGCFARARVLREGTKAGLLNWTAPRGRGGLSRSAKALSTRAFAASGRAPLVRLNKRLTHEGCRLG
jgi:hypothetical protein